MTSPILPDVILKLFQLEINSIVEIAVKKLCDEYDIDFEEAKQKTKINLEVKLDNLHISKKIDPKHPVEIRCQARMCRSHGIQQCSRRKKMDDFCLIHHKSLHNGTLKYGKMTDPIPIELQDNILKHKKKKNIY